MTSLYRVYIVYPYKDKWRDELRQHPTSCALVDASSEKDAKRVARRGGIDKYDDLNNHDSFSECDIFVQKIFDLVDRSIICSRFLDQKKCGD